MKITKTRLKQIIKEELGRVVKESNFTDAYTFTGPGKDAAPRPHPLGKGYGDKVEITKIMQYLVLRLPKLFVLINKMMGL